MIPGNLNKLSFYFTVFFFIANFIYAEDKIETVPLINLEELSPTFEEEKSELEKLEEKNVISNENTNISDTTTTKENEKVS